MNDKTIVDVSLAAGVAAALCFVLMPWAFAKYNDSMPRYSIDGGPGLPEGLFDLALRQQLRQLAVGEAVRQFDAARGKSYNITRVK